MNIILEAKMFVQTFFLVLIATLVSCVDHEAKTFPGKPVAIFSFLTGSLKLNTVELDPIFAHKDLVDRKIAVYAVDGPVKQGKDFVVDYFLKYMYKNVRTIILGI